MTGADNVDAAAVAVVAVAVVARVSLGWARTSAVRDLERESDKA